MFAYRHTSCKILMRFGVRKAMRATKVRLSICAQDGPKPVPLCDVRVSTGGAKARVLRHLQSQPICGGGIYAKHSSSFHIDDCPIPSFIISLTRWWRFPGANSAKQTSSSPSSNPGLFLKKKSTCG
jgi:hypothetical protein